MKKLLLGLMFVFLMLTCFAEVKTRRDVSGNTTMTVYWNTDYVASLDDSNWAEYWQDARGLQDLEKRDVSLFLIGAAGDHTSYELTISYYKDSYVVSSYFWKGTFCEVMDEFSYSVYNKAKNYYDILSGRYKEYVRDNYHDFICFVDGSFLSPMDDWDYGGRTVTLKGEKFTLVKDVCKEQKGRAYIDVYGKTNDYWLYDTITYMDGHSEMIYDKCVPHWIEEMGYTIDFDHIYVEYPNEALATSVRTLMKQRGCNVSVALINDDLQSPYVIINEYFESTNSYKITQYNLIK